MMKRTHLRKALVGGALAFALAGAALAARAPAATGPTESSIAPSKMTVFEVAALLSTNPPDTLVVRLDDTDPAMPGSVLATAFGADDAAFVMAAPKARSIVLVGRDEVRVDRVARQLIGSGRHVRVVDGGVEAWNQAMQKDPPAPQAADSQDAWAKYQENVALRRYFGDKSAAPPPAVKAPPPVMVAPVAAKKREGC